MSVSTVPRIAEVYLRPVIEDEWEVLNPARAPCYGEEGPWLELTGLELETGRPLCLCQPSHPAQGCESPGGKARPAGEETHQGGVSEGEGQAVT